jgi:hypothetical protein
MKCTDNCEQLQKEDVSCVATSVGLDRIEPRIPSVNKRQSREASIGMNRHVRHVVVPDPGVDKIDANGSRDGIRKPEKITLYFGIDRDSSKSMLLSGHLPEEFSESWSTPRENIQQPIEVPGERLPIPKRRVPSGSCQEVVDFLDQKRNRSWSE